MSTVVAVDLQELTTALDRYNPWSSELRDTFDMLRLDAQQAVDSVVGLSVVVTVADQDVTLTSMARDTDLAAIESSLRLRLGAFCPRVEGCAVLFSRRRDAFLDLADELKRVLALNDDEVKLDEPSLSQEMLFNHGTA